MGRIREGGGLTMRLRYSMFTELCSEIMKTWKNQGGLINDMYSLNSVLLNLLQENRRMLGPIHEYMTSTFWTSHRAAVKSTDR